MNGDINSLHRLTKEEIEPASEIAAKAFIEAGDDSKISDDPAKKMKYLTKIIYMAYIYTHKYGEIYAPSKNLEGIAAWLPHDKVNIPLWRYILYGMLPVAIRIGKEARKDLFAFDNLVKKKRKEHLNFPYWYLYNLAVNPKHQGKGWTSVLLIPMLTKADKNNFPCYLETGDRNVTLYEHFGFEVIEQISVPELDGDMYLMLRFRKK